MVKDKGFMLYDRQSADKVGPEDRLKNFNEFTLPLDDEAQREQAARCMSCGVPFCQSGVMYGRSVSGCPNSNLIPEWNSLLYQGNYREAWDRLSRTNPLPEMTSRVCPAPCEGACTNGIDGQPVTIHDNERLIADKAFEMGWVKETGLPVERTDKKVAVVGSGPAGLSAAWRLNQLGHAVTVYEREDAAGGLLMYGIPNMKLDKNVVARRIGIMEEVGITFITNCHVGVDVTTDDLNNQYDAVILACGATVPRDLNVEGRELNGIRFAVDFLTEATKELIQHGAESMKDRLKGKNVVVIGGGDTGNDCVGTCLRQGAKVKQFEIMPEPPTCRRENNPWPEYPMVKKTDYGQEEAIYLQGEDPRIFEISTTKFNDKDGYVQSVDTVKIKWEQQEERYIPVPIAGTEENYPADLVLLAMGFTGPERTMLDAYNVMPTEDYRTLRPSVFVAGDMRRGQSLVIWAIYEGRHAAEAVDSYLMD